jgi:hypothetical protein
MCCATGGATRHNGKGRKDGVSWVRAIEQARSDVQRRMQQPSEHHRRCQMHVDSTDIGESQSARATRDRRGVASFVSEHPIACPIVRGHVFRVLFTRVSCPRLRFVIHGDPSITGAAQPLQPRARSIVFGGSNSYSYSLFDFALSQSCRSIVGPFSSRPAGLGPLVYIICSSPC